jgi:hypothetical protein
MSSIHGYDREGFLSEFSPTLAIGPRSRPALRLSSTSAGPTDWLRCASVSV